MVAAVAQGFPPPRASIAVRRRRPATARHWLPRERKPDRRTATGFLRRRARCFHAAMRQPAAAHRAAGTLRAAAPRARVVHPPNDRRARASASALARHQGAPAAAAGNAGNTCGEDAGADTRRQVAIFGSQRRVSLTLWAARVQTSYFTLMMS